MKLKLTFGYNETETNIWLLHNRQVNSDTSYKSDYRALDTFAAETNAANTHIDTYSVLPSITILSPLAKQ